MVKDVVLDQRKLNSQHFIVKCSLLDQKTNKNSETLIDYGASRFDFVNENFGRKHNFPVFGLKISHSLILFNRLLIESIDITYFTRIVCSISHYSVILSVSLTRLGHYPLVLGIS